VPERELFGLRPMQESDLPVVLEWRNSERIRNISYSDHVITLEEHRAWFSRTADSPNSRHLVFTYRNKPAGVVNITEIDRKNDRCVWGFYVGPTDLPKGTGSIMGVLALDYIFSQLGIRKVVGEAFAFNDESVRFHTRLGFVEEGRLKEHVLKNGAFQDVVVMALFSHHWRKLRETLEKRFFATEEIRCQA
jgi:UDP-4-amino-4,6-dideoxy-N-acetyl-beta-L-altrosamine N-acetyltransferase